MSAILTDLSTSAVAEAIEANPIDFWRTCCSHLPGVEFYEGPDMTWFATGIPFAPFNQVLLARLAADGIDARIDEALAQFAGRGLPMLWSVTPSARPQDLGSYLEAHGLTNAGTMTGMAVDLGALNEDGQPPAGLVIERVTDLQTLEQWRHAYVHGFDLAEEFGRAFFDLYAGVGFDDRAPLRHYVGLLDGKPVAAATLHLGVAAAGVWHVGTAPAARRRGIGRALSLAPLRDARALGYRIATIYSAASGMGRNIYRRLGFQEYFGVTQYSYTASR